MQVQKAKPGYKLANWYYGKQIVIPDEWIIETMKQLCKVRQGLQIPISERFNESGPNRLPYITVKSIHSKKFEEFIENAGKRVICTEDDILFTRTGNTGEIITNIKGVFHNNFFLVNFDRTNLFKEYLIYFLKQKRIQGIIRTLAGTTTIPDLNHGDFFRLLITIPPLPEQQKIAFILSNVDNLISSYDNVIETTKKLKKGLMQQLLTKGIGHKLFQSVNFGGQIIKKIPKEWDIKTLDEISQNSTQNGLAISISDYGGGVPIVGMTKFYASEILTFDQMKEVRIKNTDKKKFSLKSFDLLFGRRSMDGKALGSAGKCIIVPEIKFPIVFESSIIRMSVEEEVNPFFIYQLLKSDFGQKLMRRIIRVSAVSGISSGDLKKIKIPVPSKGEQDEIVKIFEKLDLKYNYLDTKKSSLLRLKKALMQKLLTGQIRV